MEKTLKCNKTKTSITVELKDGVLLIWGDSLGCSGQISDRLKRVANKLDFGWPTEAALAYGLSIGEPNPLPMLLTIWDQWHMNNTRSACEHQATLTMFKQVKTSDQAIKLIGQKCFTCGWEYGKQHAFHQLPEAVVEFITNLCDEYHA